MLSYFFPSSLADLSVEDKMKVYGLVGDYIGGFLGTIVGAATLFFIAWTLLSTKKSDSKSKTYEIFAEMLRTHEATVASIEIGRHKGREALDEILADFDRAYFLAKETDNEEFVRTYHDGFLPIGSTARVPYVLRSTKQLIDIAFTVTFFGSHSSTAALILEDANTYPAHLLCAKLSRARRSTIEGKLKTELSKAKNRFVGEQKQWNERISSGHRALTQLSIIVGNTDNNVSQLREILDRASKRGIVYADDHLIDEIVGLAEAPRFPGHQNRLGHYFRNLFAAFEFIEDSNLTKRERLYLGKVLRSKLSNYEQALLALNIISKFGVDWQLRLVNKYMPIKNIPKHFFSFDPDFNLKAFFPAVKFEFEGRPHSTNAECPIGQFENRKQQSS